MEQEKQYLDKTLKVINTKLDDISREISKHGKQVDYLSQFYADQISGMDEEEIAIHKLDINTEEEKLALAKQTEQKLLISQQSPYFGRVDFVPDDNALQNIYVGILGIIDSGEVPLVCDWRAPVSCLFYDYGKGRAKYNAPIGIVEGDVKLKRQYKIKHQKLEYFFDSDINIDDEILQQSLSQNKTDKLENIVSTIQTEQNKVIRNEDNKNMLVQGYAGSGKTTVALHRVAYLLYKYKNNISSDEIVLISPSDIFSSYISGVLPQLGENDIPQITFEDLARQYLKGFVIEKREQMVERILADETQKNIVNAKESFEFLNHLKNYLTVFANQNFVSQDYVLGKLKIEKSVIDKLYFENYKEKTVFTRIDWIADYICEELGFEANQIDQIKPKVKKTLYSWLSTNDIFQIYNQFVYNYSALFNQEIYQDFYSKYEQSFKNLNYDDISPLIYIYGYLFGFDVKKQTKHLIIDEMQDYSPLQFELLNTIYPCAKTIVGDIYQSLYKDLTWDYLENLSNLIGDCKLITLNKTYRSTKQINDFAFKFLPKCDVEAFNRQGEEVEVVNCDQDNLKQTLKQQLEKFTQKYNKIAIITSNKQKAKALYFILDNENISFDENKLGDINMLSIGQCRGLEFDAVITVLNHPTTPLNKKAMFVASTRALHKLVVVTTTN